jgi:hypothetical protein
MKSYRSYSSRIKKGLASVRHQVEVVLLEWWAGKWTGVAEVLILHNISYDGDAKTSCRERTVWVWQQFPEH